MVVRFRDWISNNAARAGGRVALVLGALLIIRGTALPDRPLSGLRAQPAMRRSSFGRQSATSVDPSTTAIPPFFIATFAPVSRPTSAEKSGSCPTSSTSPRPATRSSASNGPPRAAPP